MFKVGQKLKKEMEDLLGNDGVLLFPSHPTTAPRHNMPQVCHKCNNLYFCIYYALVKVLDNS